MNKKQELHEYNIMRVIAILLVIIGHAAYLNMPTASGGVDYSSILSLGELMKTKGYYYLYKVVNWIYFFHMPLLFFISGAVFNIEIGSKKYPTINSLIIKKAKRLIYPAILWSFFWMIPLKIIANFYSLDKIPNVLFKGILLGQETGHLWFLWTLFYIFLIAYLLIICLFNNKHYFLFVFFVIAFELLSSNLSFGLPGWVNVGYYLVFFIFGYMFNILLRKALHISFMVYIIGAIGFIEGILAYKFLGTVDTSSKPILNIVKIFGILGFVLFIFMISHIGVKLHINNLKIYQSLNKNSFNIYLLHDPLNYIILWLFNNYIYYYIKNIETLSYLIILSRIIGVLLISYIICLVLNKLKTMSKFNEIKLITIVIVINISAGLFFIYENSKGIQYVNKLYTHWHIKENCKFNILDYSDDKWANGIMKDNQIILVQYDNEVYNKLLNSDSITNGSNVINICGVKNIDNQFIWLQLDSIDNINNFFNIDIVAFNYK